MAARKKAGGNARKAKSTKVRQRTVAGQATANGGRPVAKGGTSGGVSGSMPPTGVGSLFIIGGGEDKAGDRIIHRALVKALQGGPLVVSTVASTVPDEVWGDYEPMFRGLGVVDLRHLHFDTREEARSEETLAILEGTAGIFFTGGDQLKLTSLIGGTIFHERMVEMHRDGMYVAGTSAGASVVCETMMVTGEGTASGRVRGSAHLAPGFGLLPGAIVDQHFAERGRIGRLIASVASNPRILGIGIDEDTAIHIQEGQRFEVLGSGAVYVVDGEPVSYTNLAEEDPERVLSVFGLRLHVLSMGDCYELTTRTPSNRPAEEVEAELLGDD